MRTQRIPVTTATEPEAAARGSLTSGPYAQNALYSAYPDGTAYVTQRASIDITLPATIGSITSQKGRGIYFWDQAGNSTDESVYYVVDDTVYRGGPTGALAATISSGSDPVTFVQLAGTLMILDRENNEAWYIDSATPEAMLSASTITNHPVNIANVQIAGGGTTLGGYIFIMDIDGNIYNSNVDDALTWTAGDVIKAERETDTGVYLGKQNDNVVAFGTASVEFFFNAGNPNGSPLAVRPDIFYRTGAFDAKSVTDLGDVIYYVGSERVGKLGMFALEQLKPTKVSTDLIDSALNEVVRSKGGILISGMTIGSHRLTFVTIATKEGTTAPYEPTATWVFDAAVGVWSSYTTTVGDINGHFPMMGVTNRGGTGQEEPSALFISGDVALITVHSTAEETAGAADYFSEAFMVDNDAYILPIAFSNAVPIDFDLHLQPYDEGSLSYKFCHKAALVGTTDSGTSDNTKIQLSYSDDHYRTYSTPRLLDTLMNRSLARWGRFKRRIWKIAYTGNERLKIEALEMKTGKSRNA